MLSCIAAVVLGDDGQGVAVLMVSSLVPLERCVLCECAAARGRVWPARTVRDDAHYWL